MNSDADSPAWSTGPQKNASLAGRKVVVTGAAGDLGAAIAAKFIGQGSAVLLVDIRPEVESRAAKLDPNAQSLICDLTQNDCGERVLAAAVARLGGCDILIHNAAWSLHRLLEDTHVDELDRLIAVNQRAPFLLTQAFVRTLDQLASPPDDPCIVHISSTNAVSGHARLVAYAGTKGALESMTRALAVELAPRGIRVNAVRPGPIDTDQFRQASKTYDLEAYWRDYLVKRTIPPADVAEVVAFLCGPAARHITGSVWPIDGGVGAH